MTTLIACSHGTDSPTGRAVIHGILEDVRGLLPGVNVVEAFVDVQDPRIDDVVRAATADSGRAVVVPLLLSAGHHTRVDIGRAVASSDGRAVASGALGPDPLLVDLLDDRLRELGGSPGEDAVVLAAAGSTDPHSAEAVRTTAGQLTARYGWTVVSGFATAAAPSLPEAVAEARSLGRRRVLAASYVLAPGYFARVVGRSGADAVTAPLAPDPRIAAIVAERFRAHAAATSQSPVGE